MSAKDDYTVVLEQLTDAMDPTCATSMVQRTLSKMLGGRDRVVAV